MPSVTIPRGAVTIKIAKEAVVVVVTSTGITTTTTMMTATMVASTNIAGISRTGSGVATIHANALTGTGTEEMKA